jgi:hypothetical protein
MARALARAGSVVAGLVLASAFATTPLAAQSLRVAGGLGAVIPVSEFEEGRNGARAPVDDSHSLRIEWGWPVAGSRPGVYEAGVGLMAIDFPATEELGRPITVYGFTHLPLGGVAGTEFRFDAALGAALGWREFHPVHNPFQLAIGSPVTAFFQAEVAAVHAIGPDLDLTFSVGYRHFSNGNLSLPNRGINTLPVEVGLRARTSGLGPETGQMPRAPGASLATPSSHWSLHLQPFLGVRTFAADLGHADLGTSYVRQRLPVAGAHLRADRTFNGTLTVAALANLTWDAGAFRGPEVPSLDVVPLEGRAAFSFGSGVSLLVDTGPAWLEAGLGYALFDAGGRRGIPRLHQRLGVHLQVSEQVRPFLALRALSFDRPDFIEWGVAIRLR